MFGRRPGGHGKILAAHAPERLELPKTHDAFLFGRGNECHAKLPKDGYVSRHHFLLEVNPPQATIRDLRSLNGTHVNGVDSQTIDIVTGDLLLLCSDGLHGQIDDSEVCGIPRSGMTIEEMGRALVAASNRAGGRDNVTVLLISPAE